MYRSDLLLLHFHCPFSLPVLRMKEIVNLLCTSGIHGFRTGELLQGGIADRLQGFEGAHQCLAAHRADAFDIIQYRVYLAFAAQARWYSIAKRCASS